MIGYNGITTLYNIIVIITTVTVLIIRPIELPDAMFVRSFQPVAWIVAVIVEIIFAVVIYSISFKKVKKLNLRDIA